MCVSVCEREREVSCVWCVAASKQLLMLPAVVHSTSPSLSRELKQIPKYLRLQRVYVRIPQILAVQSSPLVVCGACHM